MFIFDHNLSRGEGAIYAQVFTVYALFSGAASLFVSFRLNSRINLLEHGMLIHSNAVQMMPTSATPTAVTGVVVGAAVGVPVVVTEGAATALQTGAAVHIGGAVSPPVVGLVNPLSPPPTQTVVDL